MGLVTVESRNPMDLGHNHQVLAYGYDLDDDSNLTIRVYDPNTAPSRSDDVWLKLPIGDPGTPAAFEHNINMSHPLRGFFEVGYEAKDPGDLS